MNMSRLTVFCLLLFWASPALAQQDYQQGVLLQTHESDDGIELSIQGMPLSASDNIQVRAGLLDFRLADIQPYDIERSATAVLIVIDTSNELQQHAVQSITRSMRALMVDSDRYFRYGLAHFNQRFSMDNAIGGRRQQLLAHMSRLQAGKKPSALYKNTVKAIEHLARYPAERRYLLLISTGKNDDTGGFEHRDVIQLAQSHSIVIHTIGLAGNATDRLALATLREISEDTAGVYRAASVGDFQLGQQYLKSLIAHMSSGGSMLMKWRGLQRAGFEGSTALTFSHQGRQYGMDFERNYAIEVDVPRYVPPAPEPAPKPVTKTPQTWLFPDGFWVIVAAGITLLVIVFIYWRKRSHQIADVQDEDKIIYGVIRIRLAGKTSSYPIDKPELSLGRHRGNDIVIIHGSISRQHASLKLHADGRLRVTDLGSKNGLKYAGKSVTTYALKPGKTIIIGDCELEFELNRSHFVSQDQTVFATSK